MIGSRFLSGTRPSSKRHGPERRSEIPHDSMIVLGYIEPERVDGMRAVLVSLEVQQGGW